MTRIEWIVINAVNCVFRISRNGDPIERYCDLK
jgi:hypothetical protein